MVRRGSLILGLGLLVLCLLAVPGAAAQPAVGTPRLAFVADRDRAQDLLVLDVARLTTTRLASGHSQIDTCARHYHIETIDPAGGNRQRLTTRAGHYGLLTWSP